MSAKPAPPAAEDPVAAAIANAPVGAPMTEEERRAIMEARARHARDKRTFTQEEVEAMIEERRRREGG